MTGRFAGKVALISGGGTGIGAAAAIAFLCSSDAAMITGAVLTVDGGSTIVDVPTLAFG